MRTRFTLAARSLGLLAGILLVFGFRADACCCGDGDHAAGDSRGHPALELEHGHGHGHDHEAAHEGSAPDSTPGGCSCRGHQDTIPVSAEALGRGGHAVSLHAVPLITRLRGLDLDPALAGRNARRQPARGCLAARPLFLLHDSFLC